MKKSTKILSLILAMAMIFTVFGASFSLAVDYNEEFPASGSADDETARTPQNAIEQMIQSIIWTIDRYLLWFEQMFSCI